MRIVSSLRHLAAKAGGEALFLLSCAVRMADPRATYAVQWQDPDSGERHHVSGTFRRCDRTLRAVLRGNAVDIAGLRPDGQDDTWMWPAVRYGRYEATAG